MTPSEIRAFLPLLSWVTAPLHFYLACPDHMILQQAGEPGGLG